MKETVTDISWMARMIDGEGDIKFHPSDKDRPDILPKGNVYRILSSVLSYLRIKKRRAELMLKYISLYLDTRGWVKQSEKERSLKIGLITEMYSLNQGVVG